MTRDYNRILQCVIETPEANEQLSAALAYCQLREYDLMTLHCAAAADILCNGFPELGDPIDLARVFALAFAQDERYRAAAPLN
jgi:hypothetical protein